MPCAYDTISSKLWGAAICDQRRQSAIITNGQNDENITSLSNHTMITTVTVIIKNVVSQHMELNI